MVPWQSLPVEPENLNLILGMVEEGSPSLQVVL